MIEKRLRSIAKKRCAIHRHRAKFPPKTYTPSYEIMLMPDNKIKITFKLLLITP